MKMRSRTECRNGGSKLTGRVMVMVGTLALTVWAGNALAYTGGPVSNGGSITGNVKYKGTPPPPQILEINKDKDVCALTEKQSRELLVGPDGGIQYAVVSITNITEGKPFEEAKPVLDQKGCEYLPYVMTMPAGSELQIKNSDGILHNIRTKSEKNSPINRAQPKFKKTLRETFEEPEMVELSCDVHGWMSGWLLVEDHPYYAVTDEKGAFELTDVPAGEYELRVWQPKLGETTQQVTVQPDGAADVMFELAEQ